MSKSKRIIDKKQIFIQLILNPKLFFQSLRFSLTKHNCMSFHESIQKILLMNLSIQLIYIYQTLFYNNSITNSQTRQSKMSKDKVQVLIRIRPLSSTEDSEQLIQQINQETLKIIRPGNDSYMKFNSILSSQANQIDVFNRTRDSIESFLKGVDNTIFAYGQTGAGKTYTITGQTDQKEEQDLQAVYEDYLKSTSRGIVPRALQLIFEEVEKRKEPNPRLYISFLEIYNQKIFDLLGEIERPLEIKTSKQGETIIPELEHHPVTNVEDAIRILVEGISNRVTKATYAHSRSSRSHSIFQIIYARTAIIRRNDKQQQFPIVSSLRIVDLAGSQKYKIPYNLSASQRQIHVQQLTSINSSLSSLGHCISALGDKNRTHIPFRQSKLTRVLSESLTGKGRLKLIICVSPSISSANQTLSTLQFANRAKKAIINRPKQETSPTKVNNQQFAELKRELEKQRMLRKNLQQMLAIKNSKSIIEQNVRLKQQNIDLKRRISELQSSKAKRSSPEKPPLNSPRKTHMNILKGFSSLSNSKQKSERNYYRPQKYHNQIQNNSSPDLQQPIVSNQDIKYQLDQIKKAVKTNMNEFIRDVSFQQDLF